MPIALAVAISGSLGALARYAVEGVVLRRSGAAFPWGTFAVNVTGSFLLGFVFTLLTERVAIAPWARTAVTIGFLGSYTTFSTFSLETWRLAEDGAWALATANVLASVTAGLLALYGGIVLGRAL